MQVKSDIIQGVINRAKTLEESIQRALGDKYAGGLVHGYLCYSTSGIPTIIGELMACDEDECILSYWVPVENERKR